MWEFEDDIDHKVVKELSEFVANYIIEQIKEKLNHFNTKVDERQTMGDTNLKKYNSFFLTNQKNVSPFQKYSYICKVH